jgi:hypothetical protein
MKNSLVIFILFTVLARADFVNDSYTDHPDILSRIVVAAESDEQLKSSGDNEFALYLRRAEYIGPLNAPFGVIHVARLCYIRSSRRGSKEPARGHNYVVFLDQTFKIRTCWPVDSPDDLLYVDGTKLICGKDVVMDYSRLPNHPVGSTLPQGTILFDNKVLPIPEWN